MKGFSFYLLCVLFSYNFLFCTAPFYYDIFASGLFCSVLHQSLILNLNCFFSKLRTIFTVKSESRGDLRKKDCSRKGGKLNWQNKKEKSLHLQMLGQSQSLFDELVKGITCIIFADSSFLDEESVRYFF